MWGRSACWLDNLNSIIASPGAEKVEVAFEIGMANTVREMITHYA